MILLLSKTTTLQTAIMAPCKGIGRPCWLPEKTGGLCATCTLRARRERLETLLLEPVSAATTLLSEPAMFLVTPGSLDRFLHSLYARPTKHVLKEFITHIRATTPLFTQFLYSVKYHTHTLCPVYSWALRNGFFPEEVLPSNCLRCISHAVSYSAALHFEVLRSIRFYYLRLSHVRHIPAVRRLSFQTKAGTEFVIALFEKGGLISLQPLKALVPKTVEQELTNHPFTIRESVKGGMKKDVCAHLTARMDTVREELLSQTWHPGRVVQWCLDTEEQQRVAHCFAPGGGCEDG